MSNYRRGQHHNRRFPILVIVAVPVIVAAVVFARAGMLGGDSQPTPTTTVAHITSQDATPTVNTIPVSTATVSISISPSPSATSTVASTATATAEPSSTPTAEPTLTPVVKAIASPTQIQPTASPTKAAAVPTAITSQGKKIVAIDPGHGGIYSGAVHYDSQGNADVVEKNVNLREGLLIADMLREAGYTVVMTRSSDTIINTAQVDQNGDGAVTVEDDLQARVDLINASGADLLLSLHHNGYDGPMRGTTTYYCADRAFGDLNRALATVTHASILSQLRQAGYSSPVDLGVRDDRNLGKPGGHLCLVGPTTDILARSSQMPGLVGEALFVSDDQEASLLKDDQFLRAIAAGYRDGVVQYFQSHP